MILDRNEQFVISSIGWVEHGGFVRRDINNVRLSHFPIVDADYVRLFSIDGDRFMTASHAPECDLFELSIRRFEKPGDVLWSLRVTPKTQQMTGDPTAVTGARPSHLATFKNGGRWDHHIIMVDPEGRTASIGDLPWYNPDNYDLGYQGLIDCVPLPSTPLVLISVQRSSTVVVHDPTSARDVDRFELSGCHGNPILTIVNGELWTIDYDTFVRVDISTRSVIKTLKIQPPAPSDNPSSHGMINQFAGDLFVWSPRKKAVIPRPFSSDVVIVDPDTGSIESAIKLKGQPLLCIVTSNGRLIARDWKSGDWTEASVPSDSRPWWQIW